MIPSKTHSPIYKAVHYAIYGVPAGGAPAAPWTPAQWFLASEQGIWLDPSDFTRYLADKGPELSQDLSFDDTSKWNKGSGWSVTGGQAVHNGAAADYVNSLFNPEVGKTYEYVVDIAEIPAGSTVQVYTNGTSGTTWTVPGIYRVAIFCATPGAGAIKHSIRASNNTGQTTRINSFSIKEVTSAPTATMFQDSAGTTPVTAVEQPVGLALDKRLGLALGAETVPGTALTSTAGWSVTGCTVAIVGSELEITSTGAGTVFASLNIGAVSGAHKITASYRNGQAAGTTRVGCWTPSGVAYCTATASQTTVSGSAINTVGRQAIFVVLEATAAGQKAYVSAVSIKSLAGNHASQATTAQKPVLSARKNLLTYSEQFDNAAWTKSSATITPNASVAANGQMVADRMTMTDINGFFRQGVAVGIGTTFSAGFDLKRVDNDWVSVSITGVTNGGLWLNLATGAVGNILAGIVSYTVTDKGGGWYRVEVTAVATSATVYLIVKSVVGDNTNVGVIASVDVFAHQLVLGPTHGSYQRVTTNTDYDTVGFPHYLKFDGVDDNLVTGNIDFTATDAVTVMAAVQKFGRASTGDIVGLTSAPGVTNGSFLMTAPAFNNSDSVGWGSRGTAFAAGNQNSAPYGIGYKGTLTGTADISSDTAALRSNGVQLFNATADQGTGNYANAPLYIGRRGDTSGALSAALHQLVVRGAATADLTPGETFFATKL